MANYSCKKFSPTPYPLATIHPLQTDRLDNRWINDNSQQRANFELTAQRSAQQQQILLLLPPLFFCLFLFLFNFLLLKMTMIIAETCFVKIIIIW